MEETIGSLVTLFTGIYQLIVVKKTRNRKF